MASPPQNLKNKPIVFNPKARHWAGCTWNNYTPDDYEHLKLGMMQHCIYGVIGKETGEHGTPHLQFMFSFAKPKNYIWIVSHLLRGNRLHCEVKHGPFSVASNYCKKGSQPHDEWTNMHETGPHFGNDADFWEHGVLPQDQGTAGGNATAKVWDEIKESAKAGALDDIPSDVYIKHYSTLNRIAEDHREDPLPLTWIRYPGYTETPNTWIWGPAGYGKSHEAKRLAPNAYRMNPNLKFWQNYKDEDNVIVDDFDRCHVKQGKLFDLKIWGDKDIFFADIKNKGHFIRPKIIIVTSNSSPKEMFGRCASEIRDYLEPIEQRFNIVHWDKPWKEYEKATKLNLFENIEF